MKVFFRTQPLSASISLRATTGSLHQEYNAISGEWVPDRFFIPIVIIPDITLVDPSGILPPNENGNKYLSEVEWFCNDTLVTSNDADITIDNTAGSETRGKISIRRNCSDDGAPIRLRFNGKIYHPSTKRMTEVMSTISLTCSFYTEPRVCIEGGYSSSRFFSVFDKNQVVNLFARLTQNGKDVPFMRFVYKVNGDPEKEKLIHDARFNDKEYTAPIGDLTSANKFVQKYRVKLMDCRREYNAFIRQGKSEDEIPALLEDSIKSPDELRTQSYDYEVAYKYPPYIARIKGDCVQENGDIIVPEIGTTITLYLQITTKNGLVSGPLLKEYFEVNWGDGVWLSGDKPFTISVSADMEISPIVRETKTLNTRRLNY